MSGIPMLVDTAVEVPVNICPLTDDTDFKSREVSIAYNAAGMDLVWNFVQPDGTITQTAVTPTTSGTHDWTHIGDGMYKLEIPASAGTINNDTEGVGYFTGICTGVLAWRGPNIHFAKASTIAALVTVGFPANFAALGIESDGDLTKVDTLNGHTAQTGDSFALANGSTGFDAIDTVVDLLAARLTAARAGYLDNLNTGGVVAVPGDEMDLVDAPNATAITAIGVALEAMMLDEGDASALLAAISAKVEEFLVNEGDATATIQAIATAVWANATRTLSANTNLNDPTAAAIRDAILDRVLSGNHEAAGSVGKLVLDALTGHTPQTGDAFLRLATYRLGELLSAALASQPFAESLLADLTEDDTGTQRFNANALELAPSGGGGGDATGSKQDTIITHLTDIKGPTFAGGTDALEELRDVLDGISAGSGAGAWTINYTVKEDDGVTVVSQCDVIVTTSLSSSSTGIVATGITGGNGVVTFLLDAGTYYLWRQKDGVDFTNPRTLTVNGDGSANIV